MKVSVVLLPGDGVGPEVVAEGRKVLEATVEASGHDFSFSEQLIGGASIDAHGTALTDEALEACRAADAVFLGAVGGPKWDDPTAAVRPEQGLLRLRSELGLFANLRPVQVFPELVGSSPLRPELLEGVDVLVVRELTSGIYFGEPRLRENVDGGIRAVDTMVYTDAEIRRIVKLAFELAGQRRGRVTSVDKANVLETSRLWRQVATEVADGFPEVELEHQLVDSATMRLIQNPSSFDVVVTGNMFGDILTDEASVLAGSLGMLPSASLGEGSRGMYEPIHGSAPDIAGRGVVNPIGAILSVAMMLRSSFGLSAEADTVESAVSKALSAGLRTADLAPLETISTVDMGDAICERLFQD